MAPLVSSSSLLPFYLPSPHSDILAGNEVLRPANQAAREPHAPDFSLSIPVLDRPGPPRVSLRILRALSLSRVSDVYDGGAGRRPPAGRTTEMSTTST